jgi:hypothetical protein
MRLRSFQGVDVTEIRQPSHLTPIMDSIRRTARPWTMEFDAPASVNRMNPPSDAAAPAATRHALPGAPPM